MPFLENDLGQSSRSHLQLRHIRTQKLIDQLDPEESQNAYFQHDGATAYTGQTNLKPPQKDKSHLLTSITNTFKLFLVPKFEKHNFKQSVIQSKTLKWESYKNVKVFRRKFLLDYLRIWNRSQFMYRSWGPTLPAIVVNSSHFKSNEGLILVEIT